MNVLIIPEDFRTDQYIVKPIIESMMVAAGRPNANVRVCTNPLLGGVNNALNFTKLRPIIDRYKGMVDLFLLLVDRDGIEGRADALRSLESQLQPLLPGTKVIFGENAWQELEVWLLAGHKDHGYGWQDVRTALHPKEQFYRPYAAHRGVRAHPAEGRRVLGEEAAGCYERIAQLCPEDVGALQLRIQRWLASSTPS